MDDYRPVMISVADAVSLTGVPRRTLLRWVAEDRLAHVERDVRGYAARVDANEVAELRGQRRRGPPA